VTTEHNEYNGATVTPLMPRRDHALVERYLLECQQGHRRWRPTTLRTARGNLRWLVEHLAGQGVDLRTAKRRHLKVWGRDIRLRRDGEPRSESSENTLITHTAGLFDWLVETKIRRTDPARVLHRVRVPERQPRPGPKPDPHRALVCAAANELYFTWLVMILCLGARCCEIAWAKVEDIELDGEGGALWYCMGKRNKERVIPVPAGVLRELAPFLDGRSSGPVFTHSDGTALDPERVSRRLRDFLKANRIYTTPHQFRHRFSTDYGEFDGNIFRHCRVMGHDTPEQVMKYTATTATMRPMRQLAERRLTGVPRPAGRGSGHRRPSSTPAEAEPFPGRSA